MSANTSVLQILRSYANTDPQFLHDGQLAYSFVNHSLYIGNSSGNTFIIGGNTVVDATTSAWDKANTAYTTGQLAYDTANSAAPLTYTNIVFNTANISFRQANSAYGMANAAFGIANAAFAAANTGAVAQLAYGQANAAFAKANTFDSVIGINNTQNTTLSAAWTTANLAFNVANNSLNAATGGSITGSLTVANNVTVGGNLTVLGNTVSISTQEMYVTDPLISLANNNISADLLDIGFYGTYNNGLVSKAGLIRDSGTKDWTFFQGYTPQLGASNNIDITDLSFQLANVSASIFKGSLSGGYAQIGSINVVPYLTGTIFPSINSASSYANSAFAQANTALNNASGASNYANAAFTAANNAMIAGGQVAGAYANAAFAKANTVDNTVTLSVLPTLTTHATQISQAQATATAASIYANAAFDKANTATDTWVRGAANSAGVYANAAFGFANAAFNFANNLTASSIDSWGRGQANNALGTATSGFLAANVASIYANAAFGAANAAFTSGNTSATNIIVVGAYANAAFGVANASFATSNVRGSYANAAFGTANASFLQANAAFNNTGAASSYANAAFAKANTHDTLLGGLQGISATQNTNIVIASSYANSSFVAANSAGVYANTGINIAQGAFDKANGAVIRSGDTMTGDLAIGIDGSPKKLTVTGLTTLKGQTILQDNLYGQHLLPASPNAYDLGSPDRRWRKLYIQGNTIDLEGATIGTTAGGGGIALTSNTGATFSVQGTAESSIGYFSSLQANSNLTSTSATTGALVVAGGIGANGDVFVAGSITAGIISGGKF